MPDAEQPPTAVDFEGDLATLLEQPEFFPFRLDPERRGAGFVQMSRETFRRSSFLDDRAILAGPATRFVELDALLAWLSSRATAAHFILHGAFCGSTLLARHFEELPHTLVLKEPQLLAQLAKLGNTAPVGSAGSSEWNSWFDVALGLLSRSGEDDAAVLIKAPDQVNWLASRILDWNPRVRIIFLCAPLRVFLLSALKSEDRRGWLRSRGRGLRLQLSRLPLRGELAPDELTDGQLGAALWLLNNFLCADLLARSDSERILVMNSEDLIHRPQETFCKAVQFLGLTHDEHIRRTLGAFRPISYYAKAPHLPGRFDAAVRDAALAEIDKRFGEEVDTAVVWAKEMSCERLSRAPFPVE